MNMAMHYEVPYVHYGRGVIWELDIKRFNTRTVLKQMVHTCDTAPFENSEVISIKNKDVTYAVLPQLGVGWMGGHCSGD